MLSRFLVTVETAGLNESVWTPLLLWAPLLWLLRVGVSTWQVAGDASGGVRDMLRLLEVERAPEVLLKAMWIRSSCCRHQMFSHSSQIGMSRGHQVLEQSIMVHCLAGEMPRHVTSAVQSM